MLLRFDPSFLSYSLLHFELLWILIEPGVVVFFVFVLVVNGECLCIDMTAHTPAFFTELGITHIYVECSTAGHSHVSHLWSNASRMVTHPCINWAHDCLTSVIKHKTFAPCYVSPFEHWLLCIFCCCFYVVVAWQPVCYIQVWTQFV